MSGCTSLEVMGILLELTGSNDGMSKFSSERQTVKIKKNRGTPVLSLGGESCKEHRLHWSVEGAAATTILNGNLCMPEGWLRAGSSPEPDTKLLACQAPLQHRFVISVLRGRQCLWRRVTDALCTEPSKTHWHYTFTMATHLPTNSRQDKKQKCDQLPC